jgi:hypothetical protein
VTNINWDQTENFSPANGTLYNTNFSVNWNRGHTQAMHLMFHPETPRQGLSESIMLEADVGGGVAGPEHILSSHLTLCTITHMFRDTLPQLKLFTKRTKGSCEVITGTRRVFSIRTFFRKQTKKKKKKARVVNRQKFEKLSSLVSIYKHTYT